MTFASYRRFFAQFLVFLMAVFFALTSPDDAHADMSIDPISDGSGGTPTLSIPTSDADAPEATAEVDLATGSAKSHFRFHLPKARGGAQPSLSLNYESGAGVGFAGAGWTLSTPSIARKASGSPTFQGPVSVYPGAFNSQQVAASLVSDDYYMDGQLLLCQCVIGNNSEAPLNFPVCATQFASGETLPSSLAGTALTGWYAYRKEVDDGNRYFFSPDFQTWISQTKSGHVLQFGHPLDSASVDPSLGDGLERPFPWANLGAGVDPTKAVYRWNLVREADAYGNTVYYSWTNTPASLPSGTVLPGVAYLSDIYDTVQPQTTPAPSAFAHRTHLYWGPSFAIASNSSGTPNADESPIWRATPFFQLTAVDITSAPISGTSRQLVRRYSLSYTANTWNTRQRLTTVSLTGECQNSNGTLAPAAEGTIGTSPATISCSGGTAPTLVEAQYQYYGDLIGNGTSGTPAFGSWTHPFQGRQRVCPSAPYRTV